MGALGPLDAAVVLAYFVGITLFGASFGRYARSTRDFYLAGQRLPAWLVAFSLLATTVGSYSFVKYASAGYRFGLASSQTYLNDWFWMPLFLFGWLPVAYRTGVLSVPEYFRRRFDERVGLAAAAVLLLYLVGYIGINLFTMGRALEALLGVGAFPAALVVVALVMVYETSGGQTSVVFTDFVQGVMLLAGGLLVLALGVARLGGIGGFLEALPPGHLQPFPPFNEPPDFNFVGIFWQDAVAGGVAFYFVNQGMLLRFLSARSLAEGRKAASVALLVLLPLGAVAVSGAGWVGAALEARGVLPGGFRPDDAFLVVAKFLCRPGLLGLVLAALLAALMSTADSLINATSAVLVRDLYRPCVGRAADERHDLAAARIGSLVAGVCGLLLVPVYSSYGTVYEAHGAFIAAVTPPMAVALVLAFLWPGFTAAAALVTLLGGTALMFLSLLLPGLVSPFAHGVTPQGYGFMRACYGIAISAALGVATALAGRSRPVPDVERLTVWGLRDRGDSRDGPRTRVRLRVRAVRADSAGAGVALVGPDLEEALGRTEGCRVFVDDARFWYGGLRSARCRVARATEPLPGGSVGLQAEVMERNRWRDG